MRYICRELLNRQDMRAMKSPGIVDGFFPHLASGIRFLARVFKKDIVSIKYLSGRRVFLVKFLVKLFQSRPFLLRQIALQDDVEVDVAQGKRTREGGGAVDIDAVELFAENLLEAIHKRPADGFYLL